MRFRVKRSVPFDVDSAALSYWAQPAAGKKVDVVVVMAPLEIVSRYEAPFRAAGTESRAGDDLVAGRARTGAGRRAERPGETHRAACSRWWCGTRAPSSWCAAWNCRRPTWTISPAVLLPTFVYIEDNLGGRAEQLILCGFGAQTDEAQRRFQEELGVRSGAAAVAAGNARERITRDCWAICGPSRRTTEMKIPINLASQPFRRDRAMLAASIAVSVLLVGTLGVLISLAMADRAQMADVRADISRLNARDPRRQRRAGAARRRAAQAGKRRGAGAQRVPQRRCWCARASVGRAFSRTWKRCCRTMCGSSRSIPCVDAQNRITLDMQVGAGVARAGDRVDAEDGAGAVLASRISKLQQAPDAGRAAVPISRERGLCPETLICRPALNVKDPRVVMRGDHRRAAGGEPGGGGGRVQAVRRVGRRSAARAAVADAQLTRDCSSNSRPASGWWTRCSRRAAEGDQFLDKYFTDSADDGGDDPVGAEQRRRTRPASRWGRRSSTARPIEGSDTLQMLTHQRGFEGNYANLTKFVNLLDKSPRFMIIENMQAAAPQQQGGQALNVSLKIDTFVKDTPGATP